jgi:hypothetical protein
MSVNIIINPARRVARSTRHRVWKSTPSVASPHSIIIIIHGHRSLFLSLFLATLSLERLEAEASLAS